MSESHTEWVVNYDWRGLELLAKQRKLTLNHHASYWRKGFAAVPIFCDKAEYIGLVREKYALLMGKEKAEKFVDHIIGERNE